MSDLTMLRHIYSEEELTKHLENIIRNLHKEIRSDKGTIEELKECRTRMTTELSEAAQMISKKDTEINILKEEVSYNKRMKGYELLLLFALFMSMVFVAMLAVKNVQC